MPPSPSAQPTTAAFPCPDWCTTTIPCLFSTILLPTSMTLHQESSPPIPEGLLAVAKDSRYVAAATLLVAQMCEAWQVVPPTLLHRPWAISAVLYILCVLRRKNCTLGMDVTGLQFFDTQRVWTRAVGGITAVFLLHYWTARRRQTTSDTNNNPLLLRGSARRRAFAEQRQAMLQPRVNHDTVTTGTTSLSSLTTTNTNTTAMRPRLLERARQLWQQCWETFMVFPTGGPHDLMTHTTEPMTVAWWCLRLYAAYYCLDGRFPSLGTMLLRHEPQRVENQQRLAHRPRSHRWVAWLIVSHAVGVVLQKSLRTCLEWLAQRQTQTNGGQGNLLRIQGGTNPDTTPTTTHTGLCAICQQPRLAPACPVACGHVFCWDCLHQWMRLRPECPVCRQACRPQDVLALYNYSAPTTSSSDDNGE